MIGKGGENQSHHMLIWINVYVRTSFNCTKLVIFYVDQNITSRICIYTLKSFPKKIGISKVHFLETPEYISQKARGKRNEHLHDRSQNLSHSLYILYCSLSLSLPVTPLTYDIIRDWLHYTTFRTQELLLNLNLITCSFFKLR